MKDKQQQKPLPELQLQLIEAEKAPRKKSVSERASGFIAEMAVLRTELSLLESHLKGDNEYIRGQRKILQLVQTRIENAVKRLSNENP